MQLWLLRHAKSSWDDPSLADERRPLSPRGRRSAALMRDHLERADARFDLVLCSTAERARQTLEGVLSAVGDPAIEIESALYTFSGRALEERLRDVPTDAGRVLLVGHNPAIHELAVTLAATGDGLDRLGARYPTGALAGIELPDGPRPGTGRLIAFVTPRELE